jgi:hypothetical protein
VKKPSAKKTGALPVLQGRGAGSVTGHLRTGHTAPAKAPAVRSGTGSRKPVVTKAVRTARHRAALKAAATRKKNAAKAKKAKARGLAGPGDWDSCVAEALGCGQDIFQAAGGRPDGGVFIEAVLEELYGRGLITGYAAVDLDTYISDTYVPEALTCGTGFEPVWGRPRDAPLHQRDELLGEPVVTASGTCGSGTPSLVLGLDLPSAHAVYATPDGWWSWGQLWQPADFPDATIEEAWTVNWCAGS